MKQDFINNNLQREPITAATAIGLGITAASAGGQIAATGKTNRKTREWNEKMYGIQRQDAIADWNKQNQYNSPEEQIKRLKAAGLNPALMYEGAGGGGAMTQPARGSSPGSWNPQIAPAGGMGAQLAAQLGLMQAQKENIEADTANKKGQTLQPGEASGKIIAETGNIKAQTSITKINEDIQALQLDKNLTNYWNEVQKVTIERQRLEEALNKDKRENRINDATEKTQVDEIRASLAAKLIQIEATRKGMEMADTEMMAIKEKLKQEWAKIDISGELKDNTLRDDAYYRGIHDVTDSIKLGAAVATGIVHAVLSKGRGVSETITEGYNETKSGTMNYYKRTQNK